MPDLGILFNSPPLPLPLTPTLKPVSDQRDSSSPLSAKPVKTLVIEGDCDLPLPVSNRNEVRVLRKTRGGGKMTVENNNKCLDDFGKACVENKVESGVADRKCFLPFLVGAPRLVNSYFPLMVFWNLCDVLFGNEVVYCWNMLNFLWVTLFLKKSYICSRK